jgi:hypothetical protein
MKLLHALVLSTLVSSALPAVAAPLFDDGATDLPGFGEPAVTLALAPGLNLITGTTGNPSGTVDRDYVTLVVPAGYQLSALYVRSGTTVFGSSSFIGVESGATFTVPPTSGSATGMLGWTLFAATPDTDILPSLGTGGGATGFAPPLAAGSYAFWIQETGPVATSYALDFDVTAVPEPSELAMLLAGLAALAVVARRRRAG